MSRLHLVRINLLGLLLSVLLSAASLEVQARVHVNSLSEAEIDWLAEHPEIRFAPAPNYPPVEFFDESGNYSGITADFVRLIRQRLGLEMSIVHLPTWERVIGETKAGRVDVWGAAALTPEREQYMQFTDAYITLPAVIIVRREVPGELSMEELEGKRVVVIENYATQTYIQQNYPQLELIGVPDIETGLRMVSYGIADAIVATNAVAIYYIEKSGLSNLRVAGNSGYEWRLRFAVRQELAPLKGILEKGLATITAAERRDIFRHWISLDYPAWRPDREQLLFIAALVVGLLLVGVLSWNRVLRRHVAIQTRELQQELIERRGLEERLRHLATIDPLTGILNRRSLLEMSRQELLRAQRYGRPLSMLMFDLDHFKQINDTYGHATGDEALVAVCRCCQEILRESDHVGRVGGEEFVAVLVESGIEAAMQTAERLRVAVESLSLESNKGEQFKLTLSVGVSEMESKVESEDELMHQCDEALYCAKNNGRNRVVSFSQYESGEGLSD